MTAGLLGRAEVTILPQPHVEGQLSWAGLVGVSSVAGQLAGASLGTPGSLDADAGSPQTDLEPWFTYTLTGTYTGGGSGTPAYQWRQISGPAAVLADATSATCTFTAPGTLSGASVVFGFTVSEDGYQTSPEATVQCDVLPVTERAVIGGREVPLRMTAIAS